jgi:formate dehydrogenase major subunit
MNRRELLKFGAGVGVGLAAGELVLAPEAEAAAKHGKLEGVTEFTTACNFCSCGCGMVCQVRDGKLVNMEGDPDHIINEGALCSKGAAMIATHESSQRIRTPLYRAPGSDEWQPISWDEALTRVAFKIKETRDANWIDKERETDKDGHEIEYPVHRTDAMAFLGGAQNTNEECYLMAKLSRLLGTVWVEHQARL